ncbi:hypothetical protein G6F40_017446 [Rhizopus arrhizus]|nr:hypothetical protein G6F31_020401 [Rhizopus arrhizus]KAG1074137.1 hypothetical protein G6F40_017446 [Rhizopus arrhizus]
MPVEAGDQPQQRGLARPRRPQQGEELARLDVDVHILEHFCLAIRQADVAAFDADFLHADSPSLRAGRWRDCARSTSKCDTYVPMATAATASTPSAAPGPRPAALCIYR